MRSLVSLAVLGLLSTHASAALPPRVYRNAAKNADYHVQVQLVSVKVPASTPGRCLIQGKLMRTFRDRPKKLKLKMKLSFAVACYRKGDELAPGPTRWTNARRLKAAKYLEAYLNGTPPKGLRVPRTNSMIVPKLSAKPYMTQKKRQ